MKLALVTGSTRRLGAHIAARLGEAGYTLALHASDPDHGPEAWLTERLDTARVRYRFFTADLGEDDAAAALVPRVAAYFGAPVTLLVNNASLFDPADSGVPGIAALVDHFRINAAAPFVLAQAMAERAGDSSAAIVNILDQRIRNPHGDQQAYTLSKQALAEATRMLARTLAPRVRVNGVAPGLTMATEEYGEAQLARLRQMMPLERLPGAADIAEAVVYLAAAGTVTGQTLFVDGGAAMQAFSRDFIHLARD